MFEILFARKAGPVFATLLISGGMQIAFAQTTGSIEGTLTDTSQAAMPNVVVKVINQATRVKTSNGTMSAVITREQIAPAVLNGRHYARLAMLMPGAVYSSGSNELSGAGLSQVGSPVSINGLNNKASGWFVDGAFNINFVMVKANTHVPVIETLEEVQVQTSNYSARYGTAGGSVINAVTRRGTNSFHGALYEYLRNDKLGRYISPGSAQNSTGVAVGFLGWGQAKAGPTFA